MDAERARSLVDAVAHEYDLHIRLLVRLREEHAPGGQAERPTAARFWGRLLPERVADIYEELKLAERGRRDLLLKIVDHSNAWRLSSVVDEMPAEHARTLLDLRRKLGAVTAAISRELSEAGVRAA